MASHILSKVSGRRASDNTIYHVLYAYYFLGYKKALLARIYNKSKTTIAKWITKFEKEGVVTRNQQKEAVYRKFGTEKRAFVVKLYEKTPILYQDEAQTFFYRKFGETISASSISTILHEAGLTYKILERRAIQLQLSDVIRFSRELLKSSWLPENLIFLDEVSFDGRDMLRKRGFAVKGQRLIYRGEFQRTVRMSLLCFLGVDGIVESAYTDGTFTRHKFIEVCRNFALNEKSTVRQYPGCHSIWIMDGASIHCDANLVMYLRSLGIKVIFLPAYAPFFNPIEIVFNFVKKYLKRTYQENSKKDIKICVTEGLNQFMNKSMVNLFRKCGYMYGLFDPSRGLGNDLKQFGYGKD